MAFSSARSGLFPPVSGFPDDPALRTRERPEHRTRRSRFAALPPGTRRAITPGVVTTLPSAALSGVDAFRVDVQVDVSGGLPQYTVVGLAATSVKEGGSRIRSAL